MEIKDKTVSKKSKKSSISKMLNTAALIVAILGIASLVNTVYVFVKTVKQYAAQGYPAATVVKQLIPSQLLPGIFEPIAVYGGIAIILLAVRMIDEKVSKCLEKLIPVEICDNSGDGINENAGTEVEIDDGKAQKISDVISDENAGQNTTNPENEKKDE